MEQLELVLRAMHKIFSRFYALSLHFVTEYLGRLSKTCTVGGSERAFFEMTWRWNGCIEHVKI
jgi:hypothetical protein